MSPKDPYPVRIYGTQGWLAGVYAQAPSARAVLLVLPPFPHEWQRGYRLFALLAQALTTQGISCLRFDPTGCGDSSGDDDAFCLQQLQTDAAQALAWLRAQGGAPITLLGVRAGALVASPLAQREALDWIGWQPILSGADYLQELQTREALELRNRRRYGVRLPLQGPDPGCLLGHRLHPAFRDQLREAQVTHPASFELGHALPEALTRWVEEIDLSTPFALPLVRSAAAELAGRLQACA